MKRNNRALLTLVLFALALVFDAVASTDSTFATITTKLDTWMTGSLGTTFALGSLAVGLAMGVVKQSVMSVVSGVAIALSASLGPSVLAGLFSAAL